MWRIEIRRRLQSSKRKPSCNCPNSRFKMLKYIMFKDFAILASSWVIVSTRDNTDLLRGKALRSLTAIKPLLRSPLFLKAKLTLYKSYIRPVMNYDFPSWAFISKSNMQRLQVVQNRGHRLVGGYDWYTQIDKMPSVTEIPKLKNFIKHLILKLHASAKSSRNCYIEELGSDPSVIFLKGRG